MAAAPIELLTSNFSKTYGMFGLLGLNSAGKPAPSE